MTLRVRRLLAVILPLAAAVRLALSVRVLVPALTLVIVAPTGMPVPTTT